MCRGYLVFVVFIVHLNAFTVDELDCNYVYSNNCYIKSIDHTNHNTTAVNFCNKEDIPKNVNFVLILDENKTFDVPGVLKVDFAPPQVKCKYGVTLLVNTSITNEKDCLSYEHRHTNDVEAQTHTSEKIICTVPGDHNSLYYDNFTTTLCQDNIALWFQYIFTGCYAIKFRLGGGKSVILGNTFIRSEYQRTEVSEPALYCTYSSEATDGYSDKVMTFTVDISVLMDTGIVLKLGFWTDLKNRKTCGWYNQSLMFAWTLNLMEENTLKRGNCSTHLVQAINGKYVTRIECTVIAADVGNADYCFIVRLLDERCKRHTLWRPPMNGYMPCTWIKRCMRILGKNEQDKSTSIQTGLWTDTDSYLLLPVITVIFVMLFTFGIIYFVCYIRPRNKHDTRLYAQACKGNAARKQHSKCSKPKEYDLDSDDKEVEYDNIRSKNIVLLYPKSSASFMALMADFRGILASVCQCSVHDWYDGTIWNRVAEIGGPDWFIEMLQKGSCVIWIDTPAMRSLITSTFKNKISAKSARNNSFMEIGDFRDTLYPVIFNLAKRNNVESVRHLKHFVVRLQGFENYEDGIDPFLELSPDARYVVPGDLRHLCSDLSTRIGSDTFKQRTKKEEDLIRQHLSHVKYDGCK